MKLLKNYGLSPFAIELYANQKKDLTDYFGIMHKGLTKYQLFLNPDSSVILICNYQEDGTIKIPKVLQPYICVPVSFPVCKYLSFHQYRSRIFW